MGNYSEGAFSGKNRAVKTQVLYGRNGSADRGQTSKTQHRASPVLLVGGDVYKEVSAALSDEMPELVSDSDDDDGCDERNAP